MNSGTRKSNTYQGFSAWIRKRYGLRPETEKQLPKINARQMDRRLKAHKRERQRRLYGRTKPGYPVLQ